MSFGLPSSYNLHIFKFEDIDVSNMSFETTPLQDQHVHYKNWPKAGQEKQSNGREAGVCIKNKFV